MGIYERNNCVREKFIRGWDRTRMLQCRGIIVWFPHHNKKKYMKWTSDSVAAFNQEKALVGSFSVIKNLQIAFVCPPGWRAWSRSLARLGTVSRARSRPRRADGPRRHHTRLQHYDIVRVEAAPNQQLNSPSNLVDAPDVSCYLPRSGRGVPYMQLHLCPGGRIKQSCLVL